MIEEPNHKVTFMPDRNEGFLDCRAKDFAKVISMKRSTQSIRQCDRFALTLNPSPEGRGTLNLAPFSPREKGWG